MCIRDRLKVCPKFVTSLAGFSPKQTTTINKDSVLQAARQAYARESVSYTHLDVYKRQALHHASWIIVASHDGSLKSPIEHQVSLLSSNIT